MFDDFKALGRRVIVTTPNTIGLRGDRALGNVVSALAQYADICLWNCHATNYMATVSYIASIRSCKSYNDAIADPRRNTRTPIWT
jgi:replication-associated recombination protein RarA